MSCVRTLLHGELAFSDACGGAHPARVCAQTYLYFQARTDASFRVSSSAIGLQAFGNPVLPPDVTRGQLEQIGSGLNLLPESSSAVASEDGYRPDAMLFVDEEFVASSRMAREGQLANLTWKPVVRFQSSHYRYVMGMTGPHIVQVGVGVDDVTGAGLGLSSFVQPPAATVAPPEA